MWTPVRQGDVLWMGTAGRWQAPPSRFRGFGEQYACMGRISILRIPQFHGSAWLRCSDRNGDGVFLTASISVSAVRCP